MDKATGVMSAGIFLIGCVILVRTLAAGGGVAATGVILGILFIVAGAGRFYIARTRR